MNSAHVSYKRPLFLSLLVAVGALVLTQLLVYEQYRLLAAAKRQRLVRELNVVDDRFRGILLSDITAANALAIVYKHCGINRIFDSVAKDIVARNKYVEGMQINENDTIKYAYPLKGYENIIGLSTRLDTMRQSEANKAFRRNDIYFAGPRKLTSGGIGIVGKVPIIVDGKLVAIAAVMTRLPTIARTLTLGDSIKHEYAYLLKKVGDGDDTTSYFLTAARPDKRSGVESMDIPEGEWLLSVYYSHNGILDFSLLSLSALGILLSIAAGRSTYRRLAEPLTLRKVINEKTVDLTETVAKLDQNNRELSLLNNVNDIIIKAKTEEALYQEVCNRLVAQGKYKLAWICHRPNATSKDQTVFPEAAAGAKQFLSEMRISLDDESLSNAPTVQCLLTGQSIVTNSIVDAPYFKPWRETAKKFGIASSIVLPLDTGAGYVSALSIYSGVINAFPEYEVEILKRLAANLSFAARDIRSQEARKKAEKEIRELNADLENRVVQRTEEINKLNIELQSNVKDLEVANKDLESFSYTVSHDLRAPLRNINGYISLLERGNNSLSAESTKYLASISGLTKKMGLLIDDLLAFAKVGKKELVKTNIDMNALLADALESVNVLEWNSHTTLKAGNMLPANGDYNLLKQVFVNLLSNAIKYSHTKENPVVEVGSYGNENENTYYVKDNGVGFSMEYHDKLFKVFQRLHSSSEFEGIGIGLAIAQRIVMKHDGKVGAESKEGEGATFYFTLPAVLNPETSV